MHVTRPGKLTVAFKTSHKQRSNMNDKIDKMRNPENET